MNTMVRARPQPRGGHKLLPGPLGLAFEEGSRFVIVSGHGLWRPEQMADHLERLAELVAQLRTRDIPIRVLVNMHDMGIQTPEVTEVLAQGTDDCYQPGNRVAIVVASSLAKMQMRRVLDATLREYFISEAAARAWLGEQG